MEKKIRQEGRTVTASRTTSVVSDLKGGKTIPESNQRKKKEGVRVRGSSQSFFFSLELFFLFFLTFVFQHVVHLTNVR